jgi:hypothetical protein
MTDFLTGVLSALVIYAVINWFAKRPKSKSDPGFAPPRDSASAV